MLDMLTMTWTLIALFRSLCPLRGKVEDLAAQ